jgi:hypothetical protein
MGGRTDESGGGGKEKEEEQDGLSVHSPCKALPSSASSLSKVSLSLSLYLSTISVPEILKVPLLLDLLLRSSHRLN